MATNLDPAMFATTRRPSARDELEALCDRLAEIACGEVDCEHANGFSFVLCPDCVEEALAADRAAQRQAGASEVAERVREAMERAARETGIGRDRDCDCDGCHAFGIVRAALPDTT